ncbi:peptide-methionine (S)-S-oxide reductase MsrA [Uruburuella testudinis]|uniref:Peptide methionine sulfoxide reductase MsrA n=1 Tax=Uruburuella testudinis TaxID=1282863 RepID=A0ABY4DNS0_9NEIS|nr:peptide-methionine (S)-S-oxide reductase MsrA [Uruburuella testudinis]UOO80710.1 peptide-methionine (S)-S-oxide reductase MsrA [Uruburuella testudinis]
MQTAIFAGGCFWCIEAVFNQINGVSAALSGYINGHTEQPDYAEVCSGNSGHAEAVKIEFDPEVVSYRTLLEILFTIHDPTQLNRQGHDIGSQYRSGIYYLDEAQKAEAEAFLAEAAAHYPQPIVTELAAAQTFYPAEPYHQGYFKKNPQAGYCMAVVAPKYLKARSRYAGLWRA